MKNRFCKIIDTSAEVIIDCRNNRTIRDALCLSNERSDHLRKFRRGSSVKLVGGELSREFYCLARDQPVVNTGVTDVYA